MIDQHVLNFSPIAGSRLCVAPRKRRSQLPFQVLEPEVFIGLRRDAVCKFRKGCLSVNLAHRFVARTCPCLKFACLENTDPAATIVDDLAPLQAARGLRDTAPTDAEHVGEKLVRQTKLTRSHAIAGHQ